MMRFAAALLPLLSCSLLYPVDDLSNGVPGAEDAAPNAVAGGQPTAIVVVSGLGPAQDLQDVREEVFGETSRFFIESSYGQTWLDGEVYGPISVGASGACERESLADQADAALAGSGIQLSGFRFVIYLHGEIDCEEALAWDAAQGRGWIQRGLREAAWGHLYGHLLGLPHAQSSECGGAAVQQAAYCALNDSFDPYDVMGNGTESPSDDGYLWGHPSAPVKESLGWLDGEGTPTILDVSEPGQYSIEALETQSNGIKALRIAQANAEPRRWFYVELRRPIGFDGRGDGPRRSGVVVHLTTPTGPALLDGTPQSAVGPRDWLDAALDEGGSIVDPVSGLVITAVELGDNEARVDISWHDPQPPVADPLEEALFAWPSQVRPGNRIAIEFDASQIRTLQDWVGMYRLDAPEQPPIWFEMTQGRAAGTLEAQAPGQDGTYQFRYYRGEDEEPLVVSNTVRVD